MVWQAGEPINVKCWPGVSLVMWISPPRSYIDVIENTQYPRGRRGGRGYFELFLRQ